MMSEQDYEHLPEAYKIFHVSPGQREIYTYSEVVSKLPSINWNNQIFAPIVRVRKKKLPISGQYGRKIHQIRQNIHKQKMPAIFKQTNAGEYREQIEKKMKSQINLIKESIVFNQSRHRHASSQIQKSREKELVMLLASRKRSSHGAEPTQRTAIHSTKRVLHEKIIDRITKIRKGNNSRIYNHSSQAILSTDTLKSTTKRQHHPSLQQHQYISSPITSLLSSQRAAIELIRESNLTDITYKERRYSTIAGNEKNQSGEQDLFSKNYKYIFEQYRQKLQKRQSIKFLQKIIDRKKNIKR